MSNKSLTALIVGVVLAIVLWNSFYIVSQTERAVMLRFGRIVEPDVKPGLHMKIPYVNSVRKFDARLMTLDSTTSRFLTLEKKALMVDSYAKWRVDDAERFYTATSGMKQIADERLARRLEAALRDQFGKRTLHESVSGQRDELMAQVTNTLNRAAQQELGIEVVDVRVKGIDLPREVNRSVFERMSSSVSVKPASIAPRVRNWPKVFVPTPIASVGCCWQRPSARPKSCAVTAMRRRRRSTRLPMGRTRSSTPSTAACRHTARASPTRKMCWCWIPRAISSAIWSPPRRSDGTHPAGDSARRVTRWQNIAMIRQPGNSRLFYVCVPVGAPADSRHG